MAEAGRHHLDGDAGGEAHGARACAGDRAVGCTAAPRALGRGGTSASRRRGGWASLVACEDQVVVDVVPSDQSLLFVLPPAVPAERAYRLHVERDRGRIGGRVAWFGSGCAGCCAGDGDDSSRMAAAPCCARKSQGDSSSAWCVGCAAVSAAAAPDGRPWRASNSVGCGLAGTGQVRRGAAHRSVRGRAGQRRRSGPPPTPIA